MGRKGNFLVPTEKFNKYKYQNELCEHDLSGTEIRILIRLSNCYGRNGLICPSNATIAIWLNKISQKEYDKPNKTNAEKKKLKNAKGVIKNAMAKLNGKFLKTELKGNSRKIFLLKPGNPDIRYEGLSNYDPQNKGGHQIMTPGHQIMTPGSSNDDPPIINNKISKKLNRATPDSFSNSQLPGNPDIRKELMTINQKHPTKQKGLTTINQRLTTVNPLIKKEKKEKKEKLGATPDSFNFWHPYIDEIMAAIPKEAKGKIPRAFVNEHLKKKGGDRPYFYWVFDHAADKPDPVKWITMGIRGYYAAYLKSDEYESGKTITEFTNLEIL
jgi:hypothetical protein